MGEHWDRVDSDRGAEDLAWHEPVPATLPLVLSHARPDDPVIDVGGGASTLTGQLLRRGYHDLTVVDLSGRAIEHGRVDLWPHEQSVTWLHADILVMQPTRRWALWHDRATFHFLTTPVQREQYVATAVTGIAPDGIMIVSTFAPHGPDRCAGLPVRRYSIERLADEFAPQFSFVEGASLSPEVDDGDQRPYVAVVLQAVG